MLSICPTHRLRGWGCREQSPYVDSLTEALLLEDRTPYCRHANGKARCRQKVTLPLLSRKSLTGLGIRVSGRERCKDRRCYSLVVRAPSAAPTARSLAPDNQVFAMARFSNPEARQKLEACGITCITHDLLEPFDDIPTDFDYVYHTAMPMSSVIEPLGRWPDSYDKYADATGRLMAHLPGVKGFLFASTSSVYNPPGGSTAVAETHSFGIHTSAAYAFTKVANEQIVSYLSRSLNIPATIIRVANASGVDGGPMRDRLDLIVQGKPIPLHIDKPNYARPIFEPDTARLG